MGREHRIQSALAPVFPLVPEMVAHCDDEAVIGARVLRDGRGSRAPSRAASCRRRSASSRLATLCGGVWDVLVQLHSVDLAALPDLAALGKGDGYVARQVVRLDRPASTTPAPTTSATGPPSPPGSPSEQPADVGQLPDPQRLPPRQRRARARRTRCASLAVLDWEMATVGDPLMDLGGSMAYWVQDDDDEFFRQFRRQPSNAPGMWTRGQIVDTTASASARRDARAVAVLRGLRAVPARGHRPADLVPLLPPADHQRGVRRVRPGRRLPRAALPRR